jgi:hypothetical protein
MVKRHAKVRVQGAELGWYGPQGGRTIQITYWSDSTLIGALNLSGARIRWKAKNQKGWSQPTDADEFFRILDEHRRARAQRTARSRRKKRTTDATRKSIQKPARKRSTSRKSTGVRKTARKTATRRPERRRTMTDRTRRAKAAAPSRGAPAKRRAARARTR